ncbi:DUF58 domain-containing protein [Enterococcus saccharolyticus]|uniref:DUF58 domain-containing protein n=1 Tax=Enterococcus saccharolyticus subsp. saccharolyticus ATCC 43076 TaxID=1139996 RepID=S0J9L9_9ENTE|nr:DUF58 domain-containing protein [Enterococcus saccharolyticus]EOT28967.1 hypothetical protein OMQ_01489 [Enterococcus saccharolyticus subsp. saccharolyticus ATCC 43076]EOT81333.1 hypothetical protein I572_01868 [Enterococcus saccharolyticus subsp. saccharolyticus ATCC 43076]OJG90338.1 hypothetical protein RV16_GL001739 [Enterococcus saccharolyticus]
MKQLKNWGNGFTLFLAYLFIVIYALIFTNETGWTLLLFATLLVGIEMISLLGSLRRLKLVSREELLLQMGESAKLSFEITKRGSYPLVFIQMKLMSTAFPSTISLYFFQGKKQLQTMWSPAERGYFQKVPIQVTSSDFFGWFQKKRILEMEMNGFVLPQFSVEADTVVAYFQQVLHQSTYGESSFTVKNYRPYRMGDALKQIDWKVSSRQQELIYREYQQYQTSEWVFIFYGQDSFYFEEMLGIFYSLHRQFPQFTTILIGENVPMVETNDLRQYALIQPLIAPQVLPEFHQKRIFLFTPQYSEALEEQVTHLQRDNQLTVYTYKELMAKLGIEVTL